MAIHRISIAGIAVVGARMIAGVDRVNRWTAHTRRSAGVLGLLVRRAVAGNRLMGRGSAEAERFAGHRRRRCCNGSRDHRRNHSTGLVRAGLHLCFVQGASSGCGPNFPVARC